MSDFSQFKKRVREVSLIEPNDLGIPWLTDSYRTVNRHLKHAPFLVVIPVSLALAMILALMFSLLLVRLVTVLQNGF